MFSGLYLAASISLLRHQTSRPTPRASIPESGLCVSVHIPSLVNTFLGHSGTTHEESGHGSVSGKTGCHTGVTRLRAHCTSNGPQVRSWGSPPCFRNPKAGSQASSVRRKQTATGWIFKHLLGRTSPGEKGEFWPLGPATRWMHRVFPCRIQEHSRHP